MIDSHVHVWTLEPKRYPWHQTLAHVPIPTKPATAETLLAEMDRAGVSHAVLVQPSVYGSSNDYLCDALDRHPSRFIGVCLLDPQATDAGDKLRHWCVERGCRGLRINLIGHDDASWILDTARAGLWQAAREIGASVSFQMRPEQAGFVGRLARMQPGITFVADYLGTEAFHDASGAAAIGHLAGSPNVWFKLLAVGQDSRRSYPFQDLWPMYEHAVRAFGAHRIVFGTDFPHVCRACTYEQAVAWLRELPFLDSRERALIAEANARRLWGLDNTIESAS